VPVLRTRLLKGKHIADNIATLLKDYRVVLVQGHGSFATGQLLEEAYHLTAILEQSCRLLYLLKLLKINPDAITQ
jgi:L-fuculose-phosphate aldolase